jgi:hypothetical protein
MALTAHVDIANQQFLLRRYLDMRVVAMFGVGIAAQPIQAREA